MTEAARTCGCLADHTYGCLRDRLAQVRALLGPVVALREQATKGEWVVEGDEIYSVADDKPHAEPVIWCGFEGAVTAKEQGLPSEADAAFIVAAANLLPQLAALLAEGAHGLAEDGSELQGG